MVIIHQDAHGRHVKTREISLRDKEFAKVEISYIIFSIGFCNFYLDVRLLGSKTTLKPRPQCCCQFLSLTEVL